jgi:hypothetical protein
MTSTAIPGATSGATSQAIGGTSIEELEQEQIEYLNRIKSELSVPDTTQEFPDALRNPIERPVVLDPQQEQKIIEEVVKKMPMNEPHTVVKPKPKFSFSRYFDILSESFVGIMDDLLNFDGDVETFPSIFTKDERLVLVGTIVMIVSIYILFLNKQ